MTDKATYTPGPWRAHIIKNADESVTVSTHGSVGLTIARVHQGAIAHARPNAHLIAAAPELYEALEHLLCVSEKMEGVARQNWNAAILNASAVLAKARGEAS